MNESNSEEIRPAPGDRMATSVVRVFRFIVRILLIILLGASLGAAAYFGVPALYRDYIEPVQTNSQRISELENAMKQVQSDSRSRSAEIGERLAGIEGQQAEQQESLSEMHAKAENLQIMIEQQYEEISDLQYLVGRLDALKADLQKTIDGLEALEVSLVGTDAPVQRLERQLQLVRVMELLTRARFWLTQDNFGLAAEDIQAAVQALKNLADTAPEGEAGTLPAIIERLNLAIKALPGSPVIAADDLEIAWKLLIEATEQPNVASD